MRRLYIPRRDTPPGRDAAVSLPNLTHAAGPAVASSATVVDVGFSQLLFAPLERRAAERWGFDTPHA